MIVIRLEMPELKIEALNQFNSFHNEPKNHCTYPMVLYATDSLLCTVPPNLVDNVEEEDQASYLTFVCSMSTWNSYQCHHER